MEVRAEKEKLIWMTGTRRFKATFKDLAATVKLSYHGMKRGKLAIDLERIKLSKRGVNWANSKFLCNNLVLRLAQLTPCAKKVFLLIYSTKV